MWTKRELVAEALNELALAGYTFDTAPEEQAQAIRTLDRMAAGWTTRAISIGYKQPTTPGQSDPDDDSGISDAHADAVVQGLAVRLCGSYGKQPPLMLLQSAKSLFDALLIAPAQPVPQPLPAGVPLGAGNKRRGYGTVFTTGCEPLSAPCSEPAECCEPGLSFTVGAPILAHTAVAVLPSGLAVPADCMTLAHADVVAGLALSDAAASAVVRVQSGGEMDSNAWAFTAGQPVFVGIGGALVQTVPAGAAYALQIGAALTPTRVLINLQLPVIL